MLSHCFISTMNPSIHENKLSFLKVREFRSVLPWASWRISALERPSDVCGVFSSAGAGRAYANTEQFPCFPWWKSEEDGWHICHFLFFSLEGCRLTVTPSQLHLCLSNIAEVHPSKTNEQTKKAATELDWIQLNTKAIFDTNSYH